MNTGVFAVFVSALLLILKSLRRWLDPLKTIIAQVDEKFSEFFRSMGCAGEVSLLEDKDNVRLYYSKAQM